MKIINALLDSLAALPLYDIIMFSEEGTLLVNGRPLEPEKILQLRESARIVLNSQAMNLIYDQVAREAINMGLRNSVKIEDVFFAKAALWWRSQESRYLKTLAQTDDTERELTP